MTPTDLRRGELVDDRAASAVANAIKRSPKAMETPNVVASRLISINNIIGPKHGQTQALEQCHLYKVGV